MNKKNNVLFAKPIALASLLLTAMLISSHSFAGQVTFTVDDASTCIKAGLCSGSNSSGGSSSNNNSAPAGQVPTVAYSEDQSHTFGSCHMRTFYGAFNGPGYYNKSCDTPYTSMSDCTTVGGVGCVYVDKNMALDAGTTLINCAGQPDVNVGSWVYRDNSTASRCGSVISTSESACMLAVSATDASNVRSCIQMPKQN